MGGPLGRAGYRAQGTEAVGGPLGRSVRRSVLRSSAPLDPSAHRWYRVQGTWSVPPLPAERLGVTVGSLDLLAGGGSWAARRLSDAYAAYLHMYVHVHVYVHEALGRIRRLPAHVRTYACT